MLNWRLTLMVFIVVWAAQSNAAEPMKLTDYEHAHVFRQLQERGWQVDPKPLGNRVAFVEVYRYEVFVPFERLLCFPIEFMRSALNRSFGVRSCLNEVKFFLIVT